jgi:protein-tyrosine-phosphatase
MYLQTMENTLQKEIQSIMNNYRIEIEQYQHQLKYEEKCKNSDLILILGKHNNLNLNPKNLIQRMTIIIYYQFSFFI